MNVGILVVAWILVLYTGALVVDAVKDEYEIPQSLEQMVAGAVAVIVGAGSWKTLRIARKTGKK